jgi:hypothetical protein
VPSVGKALAISPETEHYEKINAAMDKCGLTLVCCKKFDEARFFLAKQKFAWSCVMTLCRTVISGTWSR